MSQVDPSGAGSPHENMRQPALRAVLRKKGIKTPKTITEAECHALIANSRKGRRAWKPAQKLALFTKLPGFRYRWCDTDAQNLLRKKAEGWFFVNPTTGAKAEHDNPGDSGQPLDTNASYRDLILMAMTEEDGLDRDAHFQDLTDRQSRGLLRKAQRDAVREIGPDVEIRGVENSTIE